MRTGTTSFEVDLCGTLEARTLLQLGIGPILTILDSDLGSPEELVTVRLEWEVVRRRGGVPKVTLGATVWCFGVVQFDVVCDAVDVVVRHSDYGQ